MADLFKHMPVGYVRMVFYDEDGHVKDYYFMDSGDGSDSLQHEGIVGSGNMLARLIRICRTGCLIWKR